MMKITFYRRIGTALTPFIYIHSHKYHITNVYHKLDIAPIQKVLKIHCLHWKTTSFCLEHGYIGVVNTGSDYVGFFYKILGSSFFFAYGGLVSPTLLIRGMSYS